MQYYYTGIKARKGLEKVLGKPIKKFLNLFGYLKCTALYFFAVIISVFLKRKPFYKDLWLVAERGADARDNGYHFFKYLCLNHKDINCVYVIDISSPDYEKIATLGKTVQPGSFKHYLAFACATAKISTHIMGYAPDSYRFAILDRKLNIVKGKKIFLQHGIIKDNIYELYFPKVHLDLFICSTVREQESIEKDYNYPDGVIKRIGLCRYDALLKEHTVKRQILVMPTWRYYLRELDEEGFKKSEYYKMFNGLITDGRLLRLLEENGYELVLYLHYELQKFTYLFSGKENLIKITGIKDADVQKLLMESAMLITDYSSIFFDFAYMKKPLCYWMFDRELFFSEQYGKGYFSFDDDGFGPVCSEKDEVIDYIEHELSTDMALEKKYEDRIKSNFDDFSENHCEKTYEEILKLLGCM